YATASPFHLTRYETNPNEPAPKDPQRASTNLTKNWQRKEDHFTSVAHIRRMSRCYFCLVLEGSTTHA
ncbi:MAG: hypothetical protein ACK49I_09785, partial [Verrucomicrobiota bacterium]